MPSDTDYEIFDYRSNHDHSYYDDLIDQFDYYQSFKCKKTKQRQRIRRHCVVPRKVLRGNAHTIKVHCVNDEITPKAPVKTFRYSKHSQQKEQFECDQLFEIAKNQPNGKTLEAKHHTSSFSKKIVDLDSIKDFASFQRHFYCATHESIKSACKSNTNVILKNIRPAPTTAFVQEQFMQRLQQESSFFPSLVYHGTDRSNFDSILEFGFLVPNRQHPTNPKAPIIKVKHGQAFGVGIYGSQTPGYSIGYTIGINTLLACAALPVRRKDGRSQREHGNIVVLPSESRIIPMFLVDFFHMAAGSTNYSTYPCASQISDDSKSEGTRREKTFVTRKYLRKLLNYINDDRRKNDRYQRRSFEI